MSEEMYRRTQIYAELYGRVRGVSEMVEEKVMDPETATRRLAQLVKETELKLAETLVTA